MENGALTGVGSEDHVVPQSELKKAFDRIKRLEQILGRKTEEVEILKEGIRIGREKNDLAHAVSRSGRFRIKRVASAFESSRSNLIKRLKTKDNTVRSITKIDNEWLLPIIQKMVSDRPTYGYRRVTALLGKHMMDLGLPPVNHKRVYRIMKRNGLVFPKIPKRPSRTHDGKIITMKSNMRWCTDCFGPRSYNGDLIQVSFVLVSAP